MVQAVVLGSSFRSKEATMRHGPARQCLKSRGMDALAHNFDHAFSDLAVETEERRSSTRSLSVYRVVKVSRDGSEGLARCRNISDSGMKLETSMPLSLMETIWVEIAPGTEVSARVVWTNGDECGVAFDEGIDCAKELRNAALARLSGEARSPRLQSAIPARIEAKGVSTPTTVGNVSQQGMLVSHKGDFHPGLRVKVVMGSGIEKSATVQWSKDNFAGLYLFESFSVMELGEPASLGRANDDI
jgi:hypothetical protein